MSVDASRLAAVISPLRRALLGATRERAGLPDIPDAQIEVIRALPRDTTSTPGELAARLGLGRSTISNLLAAMERAELVVRRPRADDRRAVDVSASPEALRYFDTFDRTAAEIVADAAASLPPEHRAALTAALPALEGLRDALVVARGRTQPETR